MFRTLARLGRRPRHAAACGMLASCLLGATGVQAEGRSYAIGRPSADSFTQERTRMRFEHRSEPSSRPRLDEVRTTAPSPYLVTLLRAEGLSGPAVSQRALQIEALVEELAEDLGRRPSYRHARRLHHALHDRWLRSYEADADSLSALLDHGRFNCLSGTLLYAYVARSLGYAVQVIEIPGHLMLQVRFDGRTLHVETTDPEGFDTYAYRERLSRTRPLIPQTDGASGPSVGATTLSGNATGPYGSVAGGYVLADPEQAVAFAWLNAGWRALEQGHGAAVRAAFWETRRHFPELTERASGVRTLLSRAFDLSYEVGDFREAFALATAENSGLPYATSARDRLVAAALKRIQLASDQDQVDEAEAVLTAAQALLNDGMELQQLQRHVLPLIAMAAVRTGRVQVAAGAVDAFNRVEPDPAESARLALWVRSRTRPEDDRRCGSVPPGEDWNASVPLRP